MGHRFEALSLPPDLAAWREAGLELVLRDFLPAPAASAEQDLHAQPSAMAEARAFATASPLAATSAKAQALAKAILGQTPIPATSPAAMIPGADLTLPPGPATDPLRVAAPEGHGRLQSDAAIFSPAARPGEPWPVLSGPFAMAMEKLKPATRVLWTYWELALDFGGEPDAARRALCASIIKHLPYKDTTSFWPLSERQDGTILARPGLFWQAAERLGATHVLCFGRQACMTLFPGRPFSCGVFRHGQLTAVILPGFDEMLPDNRQTKARAWSLLKDLPV